MIVQKVWIYVFFMVSSGVYASQSTLSDDSVEIYDDSLPISEKDWYRQKTAQAAMKVCHLMDQDHFAEVHRYHGITLFFDQWRHSIRAYQPEVDNVQQKAVIVCSVIQGLGIPLEQSPKIEVAFKAWNDVSTRLYIIELANAHETNAHEKKDSVAEAL